MKINKMKITNTAAFSEKYILNLICNTSVLFVCIDYVVLSMSRLDLVG